ncbi:kinase-like domain-containing protein [Chaetomium sp. MPI-CAGE-AT-0009]|nr:kinase-like domain-containing protein [Chaetomium sp. MPI-CAGE-AT-0009]
MASQNYASPTESEFDEADGPDSVKNWDEDRVCEYLRSVKCGEYEKVFRRNHINGENLLEIDKEVLKEMGVDKVGDRVRLFLGIKKLRTKTYANQKRRNRESFAGLDMHYVPSSPRPSGGRAVPPTPSNKRYSRQYDLPTAVPVADLSKPSSRPSSPLPSADFRARQRYPQPQTFAGQPTPASARFPMSPRDQPHSGRFHQRNQSSMDGSLMAALPPGQDVIRVISTGGGTKVVKIAGCNTCEEVMRVTLRKFALREDHERNYCFWVLNGVEADPNQCRRLGDTELWRVIKDHTRPERNRLILRRVPAGEPGQQELERAAAIAMEEAQQNHNRAIEGMDKRSQMKAQKLLGESWETIQQPPLSPVSYQDRERNVSNTARDLERPAVIETAQAVPRRKGLLRQFGGLRPPSELIASDLTSYFPDHSREAIDRTARMSMRRSQRLSRVNHRLSVASTMSFASTIQDAPPIPTIADSWLTASNQIAKVRARDPRFQGYRDSVASSMLDTLQEESSPIEPNRKSYVSFADSGSDTAALSITDPDGNVRHSYFDESTIGSGGSGSLENVNQALTEDGEDADEELQSFLAGESWDDSKWMKGAMIGQGSFGSVYLALHAVTGELLAVKQVETPSPGANSQSDSRKKSMIDALKREISLLRDLRHPNIVQYLGCGSSAEYLNIFLEYVAGGSVQTMLNSYGALPEPLIRSFVRQILNGLSYLHNRDIIHRDIKGANILVDNKGTIKISDFGISKKLEATNILNGANNNKHRPSLQGSVFWMAPEVVKQTSYTRKADIWSLGCLVVEMMTGQHPFPDCTQLQAIFKIGGAKATPTIPDNASEEARQFLAQTFEIDHNKRPSADELMLSPFLTPPA